VKGIAPMEHPNVWESSSILEVSVFIGTIIDFEKFTFRPVDAA
jgi:hypothetical protein